MPERLVEADVLVCGSPNYCGYPSAALRAFMERMEFPAVNYSDYSKPVVLKRICSATIYTMNCPNEEVYRQMNYPILMDTSAQQLGVFGPTEILCSYDTDQFSNLANPQERLALHLLVERHTAGNHFGKFVREHLGMSPTEYRQQNLNNSSQ